MPDGRQAARAGRRGSARDGLWSDVWMRIAAALVVLGVLAAAAGLLGTWLSGGDEDGPAVFTGDVKILSPQDRATVTSPVQVTVESPTYRIADPAEGVQGAAHFALFVDFIPITASGQVIPREAGIYHFSTDTVELDLEPGLHRITVALADNQDVRIPEATVRGITITVE